MHISRTAVRNGRGFFMKAQYITATEVAEIMGISRSKSYQIVRQLNKELKAQGYLTVAGKCPIQYFKLYPLLTKKSTKMSASQAIRFICTRFP